jgi:solute carrier family 15 (peptide/histidine transporter), member 3/4
MALQLLSVAIGNYLSGALVLLVIVLTRHEEWLADDLNNGHLDRFFLLLAGMMV